MIVSTNVVNRKYYSIEFNDRGKLQTEGNTFWCPSIPLFDYMLRYLRLAPIDRVYLPTHRGIPYAIRKDGMQGISLSFAERPSKPR
jgi:hypothetical protein